MSEAESSTITVEVAYARPDTQVILSVVVPRDATVEEAIEVSGIANSFPEIDLGQNKVGVFGKLAKLSGNLRDKDRIEIYRPLIADPKEIRRQRAAMGKRTGKGGGDLA